MDRNNNLVIAGWETLDVQVSIEQTGGESDPNPDSAPEPRNQPYRKLTTKMYHIWIKYQIMQCHLVCYGHY